MPKWRFARMTPAEMNQNPIQGEFFTAASDLPERLVREAIQNSLDARLPDPSAPVRVRFAFSGDQLALPPVASKHYLTGLKPHLETVALESLDEASAPASLADAEPDAVLEAHELLDKPMSYLAVEDFATFGLRGDLHANSAYEAGNHFWGFFRSVGISPKQEDDGGSWGLGKWVFPDASRLNIFFGVTLREGEAQPLLMGQAVFKTHTIEQDGKLFKYPAYGSLAAHSRDPDHEWLPLPITDQQIVRQAQADFDLKRGGESGLSVIIPFPRDDLTTTSITRAVLTQYFLSIVRGDLVVEVHHPDQESRLIDKDTIDDVVFTIGESDRDDESSESLGKAMRLARQAMRSDDLPLVLARASQRRDELLAGQDVDALRDRFNRGEVLAFELSARVTRKHGARSPTSFRVFLERDDELSEGHDYLVRGHLRIPQMDHIKSFPARALVLVEGQSELGHLLRDAEGPAHISWDPHAQRLKDRWTGGYNRVQEVRRAAPLLLQSLVEVPRDRLKDLLADLFPMTSATTTAFEQDSVDSRRTKSPVRSTLTTKRSPLSITKVDNGFSVHAVTSRPEAATLPGASWSLSFAYDVARGGQRAAFTSFKQGVRQGAPDFSLYSGDLRIAVDGCRYEITSENEILIKISAQDFRISVTGLDDRDVVTDLHPYTRSDGGEDE